MSSAGIVPSSSVHFAILWAAALLVPRERRAEWLAEWRAELWYASKKCGQELAPRLGGRWYITAFCLGSFKDALWLRRNAPPSEERATLHLESPRQCIAFLAALAALSMAITFLLWLGNRDLISLADLYHQVLIAFPCFLVYPSPILLAITSLSLGEFPAHSRLRAWRGRLRRGTFFLGKVALVMLMVFCGLLIGAYNVLPSILMILLFFGMFGGYPFALRWALNDQRGRCPVCLHLLTQPVSLGARSRCFLGLNGTGLMCPKGHGLLHLPESPTSWFGTQRWLGLDSSCRDLS
jgi:hypothetical protein